jgi:pyruvate, orthophosphate dikinase
MVVYRFDHPHLADRETVRRKLGGKGASLWAMSTQLGLPTPPGVTIPTCYQAEHSAAGVSDALMSDVLLSLDDIGRSLGRYYGDASRPLLVSVRSGAAHSMPGMMDTLLNVGLTSDTVQGLAALTGNQAFAHDSYRRFLQQFAETILEIDTPGERSSNVETDIEELRKLVAAKIGSGVLDDPVTLLKMSIDGVFGSWQSERARHYRKTAGLDETGGTAVTVQAMVFGNLDDASGTGVVFSRDPKTGERRIVGDYVAGAQGEEVVSGAVVTQDYDAFRASHAVLSRELEAALSTLEHHYRDMVDVEFTVESGKLWILQSRVGKRTPSAAARIALEMVENGEFGLTREEVLDRIDLEELKKADLKSARANMTPLASGLAASQGLATGRIVLTADEAVELGEDADVILVRQETSPADIHGMSAAKGILTTLGGQMSHAAVIAREWGIPAVVGAEDVSIGDGVVRIGHTTLNTGDVISIDGSSGNVFAGQIESDPVEDRAREIVLSWQDQGAPEAPAVASATRSTQEKDSGLRITPEDQEEDMPKLQGKTAIITGATGGIGSAAARTMLTEGANIVIAGRNQEKLSGLEASLGSPDRVATVSADVSNEADVQRIVATARERFGGVDVLFANAGMEGSIKPLTELSTEEFDRIQHVNVRGTWLSMKHCLGEMLQKGRGSIILTSSVAGMVGVPGLSAYAASKHALVGLTQVAALEFAEHGVRVNAVAPAPIDNDMMRSIEKQAAPDAPEAAADGFRSLIPMKRYGTNDEVANLVVFLASDAASFCNGGVYPVDGGFLAA